MAPPPPTDLKPRLAATYDAIAQTYFTHFVQADDPLRLSHLTYLLSLLQSQSQSQSEPQDAQTTTAVLELGCGAGIPVTKTLLEHTMPPLHVTANDFSPVQLRMAREHLSTWLNPEDGTARLSLVEGDMAALSFPSASFDAVLGFYSLIHLPRDEQTALMGKIAGWLKPGGLFLANFAQQEAENMEEPRWLGEEKGWAYWSGWGEEGSVRMVEEAGFEVVKREVSINHQDANFVWIIARKK